ncbi:MAG: sensor histidine kinase [Clostridiales bacterium]
METPNSSDKKNLHLISEKEKFSNFGLLTGGLLHNLGTPLMGSSGQLLLSDNKLEKLLNMVNDDKISDDELIKVILELKNHNINLRTYLYYMSDVINSVKSYIRKTSNSNNQIFKLSDLFKKVQMLTSFEAKSNFIKTIFSIESEDTDLSIKGDISILIQILINLIENSIHSYNGKKGQILIKSNIEFLENKENIKISVIDNGSGMDFITQSKILKQMYSTKEDKGTGIGLYMSNMLIKDKFNGIIKFDSKPNEGTNVYVYIPNYKK